MKAQVVSFHYTLKDTAGKTLESSHEGDPIVYLEGVGQIIPGLEKELKGLKKGAKKNVVVEKAYGEWSKDAIVTVKRDQLPPGELKVGTHFTSESPDGHSQVFTVTKVNGDSIEMDGNHPLAGKDLAFDVEIVETRDATKEETEHGHAHGPGGHHGHSH